VINAHEMAEELKGRFRGKLLGSVPMRRYTTIKVGGEADALFMPADESELKEILDETIRNKWPHIVLGAGSNVIVRDGGIEGLVIYMKGTMNSINVADNRIIAGAGATLPELAKRAGKEGLTGLEWAVSIPGTIGGAVVCNAGAFGSSIADVFEEADAVMPSGEIKKLGNGEISFSYRSSSLPSGTVLKSVTLGLKKRDKKKVEALMKELVERRKENQPLGQPSSGSIFRNPESAAAGRLIEEAGCKGMRRGGAMVSEKHANFIINTGGATAADVIALIDQVCSAVKNSFGVELELEVQIIGREA